MMMTGHTDRELLLSLIIVIHLRLHIRVHTHPVNPSSNKRGFRHPDVLSGRSAPTTGSCRMKPPPPAAYGADGCVEGVPN
jgi:hypothetical protein